MPEDDLSLLMRKSDCKDYAAGRVETRIERGRRMRMNVIVLQTGTHNGLLVRIRCLELRNFLLVSFGLQQKTVFPEFPSSDVVLLSYSCQFPLSAPIMRNLWN